MSRPHRLPEALRQHLEEVDLEPGRVHHVEIRHDDDCAHWSGRECDCEPELESGERIERKYSRESGES